MITQSRLKELLSYDAETGIFTWREDRHGRRIKGKQAGSVKVHGYVTIRVDLKAYYAHRLAWLYVHGKWPPAGVDHINRAPADNRIANLREATQSQNMTNVARSPRNKSGYRGVSWSKKDRVWRAYISIGNKSRALGSFNTPEAASQAYQAAASAHYGQFWRPE